MKCPDEQLINFLGTNETVDQMLCFSLLLSVTYNFIKFIIKSFLSDDINTDVTGDFSVNYSLHFIAGKLLTIMFTH